MLVHLWDTAMYVGQLLHHCEMVTCIQASAFCTSYRMRLGRSMGLGRELTSFSSAAYVRWGTRYVLSKLREVHGLFDGNLASPYRRNCSIVWSHLDAVEGSPLESLSKAVAKRCREQSEVEELAVMSRQMCWRPAFSAADTHNAARKHLPAEHLSRLIARSKGEFSVTAEDA